MSVFANPIQARADFDGVPEVLHLVTRYVSERQRLGQLTGTSVPTVRYRLWLFVDYVGPHTDIRKVTTRRVERWLLGMKVNASTLRVRLSAVKTFLGWCVDQRYLRSNPAAGIHPPRQPHLLPPRALTADQVASIYRACRDPRAELIITLMVQQGLRAAEVANLEVGDVDRDRGTLTITGKGGHQRALPITTETTRVLTRYFAESPLRAGALIRSRVDTRKGLNPDTVSKLVATVMHDAGLDETGHALRHTCASDLLDRGVHVRTVQYILGHSSLVTTQRYLRRFVGDLREAMDGRDYRQ